jgi:hypothetical protein
MVETNNNMQIFRTLAILMVLFFAGCLQTATNRGGDDDPGDPPTQGGVQYQDCTPASSQFWISFSVSIPGTSSTELYNYELKLTNGSTVNTYTGQNRVQGLYNLISIPQAPTPSGWAVEVKISPTAQAGDFPGTCLVSFCYFYPNLIESAVTVNTSSFSPVSFGYREDYRQCSPTSGGYLTVPRCHNNQVKVDINQTGTPGQSLYVGYKLFSVITCSGQTHEIKHQGYGGSRNGTLNWSAGYTYFSVLAAGYDPATVKMQIKLQVDFISFGASATGTITVMGVGPQAFSVAANETKTVTILLDQPTACVFQP